MATKETTSRGAFDLARFIDHTLLKPEATNKEIELHCETALQYQFYSVCLHPIYVSLAREILRGSTVQVCTVVGFPLGANLSRVKAVEAAAAVSDGANELDMVMAIGRAKAGDWARVTADIREVVRASEGRPVKVIIETALLSDDEKLQAADCCLEGGAQFVKTSTGFSKSGATAEDIRLLRNRVGPQFGVKASGGIRNREDAEKMIQAGASRLGTSLSVEIVLGKSGAGAY